MKTLLTALLFIASTATTALAHPGSAIVVDRRGYVYFVDTGSGVWMIDPSGKLVRHEGPRFHWMAIDESARPAGARLPSIPNGEVTAAGANPTLLLSSDMPVALGTNGDLYFPELGRDDRLRLMRFTRSGARTVFAILPSKAHGGGVLGWINGLTAGPGGSFYYTEDKTVRKIDARGVVSTVAANVTVPNCTRIPGSEPANGPALRGLAVDPDGDVFVAASACGAVLKITPRGETTSVLRSTSPWSPTAVAVSPTGLYVLEYLHTASDNRIEWVPRVRKVLPDGRIVSIAAVTRAKAP